MIPTSPKIYHITHLNNLATIVAHEWLWSDARRIELGLSSEIVGIPRIKQRRLAECPVKCHRDTMVGQYVPFNLCPRSVMLYLIFRANHPDLTYRDGQEPIVHLTADLRATVEWASQNQRR